MIMTRRLMVGVVVFFVLGNGWAGDNVAADAKDGGSLEFTGEILTLLYVTDVQKSVLFYKSLGFIHDYYYDYETGNYSRVWKQEYPPQYAEMIQGAIRIALTTADEKEQIYGGGVRHYFMITDVRAHFATIQKNGVAAKPNEVEVRPWMSFFTVVDPDNHQIVFGEKNQVHYNQARNQIESQLRD